MRKILRKKIMAAMELKQQTSSPSRQGPRPSDLHTTTETHTTDGYRLEPHIADTAKLCWDALDRDATVLFEGAQGTMLDLDHGTYPFVTSSNPIAGSATIGAGVGPGDLDEVWGIAKAYATRVGAGPFPTELDDEMGEVLRERGGEVGTTTGRPRRTGWIDTVALRYGVRLNGMTAMVVTKLDVLSGIDPLRICVRYRHPDGAVFEEFPYHQSIIHAVEPEYEEMPGFEGDIGDARREEDLPAEARDYLRALADHTGVPVVLVGVGPGREQVIWMGKEERLPPAATLVRPPPEGVIPCCTLVFSPRRRIRSASSVAPSTALSPKLTCSETTPSRVQ